MPENQKICGKNVKMWDPKHANFYKEMYTTRPGGKFCMNE